ncbi:MAG: maleylpyruvate isomerase family mycothiol-dependent enzyme [Angustibacter sp.]
MVTQAHTEPVALGHEEWMARAGEEYERLLTLLRDLEEDEAALPTECPGWDVTAMVAHLAGAAQATADLRRAGRQARAGRALLPGAVVVDQMNAAQVRERAQCTLPQLVDELQRESARGVRARRRLPAVVRALRVPFGPPLGVRSVGYLMDRIYTRDAWMHRIDVCRATGRPVHLTPGHDGRIVSDVVGEWASAHGRPVDLTLTGPAGGRWALGEGDREHLELDAIELCRRLSGRTAATDVPSALLDFTVAF